jgi:biopolymer transport protein ExbD
MRLRSHLPAGVKLDMTPMIDIVFQLLIFFVMTLRIATQEGDLAMQLPIEGTRTGAAAALPLRVALFADEQGRLQAIELNGRAVKLVGNDPALAAATEAHLACDEALAYEHTIAAVTAVTGTLLPSGEIHPLAGKVRFVASPKPPKSRLE